MERRGCGLGCLLVGLGFVLSACLMPYLVSSVYSIASTLLQVPAAPDWLWGDWLNSVVGESKFLYMIMAEGPICCVGSVGLLIVILGLVLMINGLGRDDEYESEAYDSEAYDYGEYQSEEAVGSEGSASEEEYGAEGW